MTQRTPAFQSEPAVHPTLAQARPASLRLTALIHSLWLAASALPAVAQTSPTNPTSPSAQEEKPAATVPANPPATAPGTPTRPARPTTALKSVDITGVDDTEKRRQSTAAKIIVGRDDIERYGDSTMGELLKRLPGITMPGRPGRGGPPAMRGLGGGYTQIMVDGERVARGFSLDDLSPDQIERIEILRAPTAETGARAIAGTINIVTRGGYTRKVNTVNAGFAFENGHVQPSASWSRNDKAGDLIYNFSLSGFHGARSNDTANTTLTDNLTTGDASRRVERLISTGERDGLHANGRLQWRTDSGDSFTLMPMLVLSQGRSNGRTVLTQVGGMAPYDTGETQGDTRFYTLRLSEQWVKRLGDGSSLFVNGGIGRSHWNNAAQRQNTGGLAGDGTRSVSSSEQRDTTLNLTTKFTKSLNEVHSLVAGMELESNRRNEDASTLINGESPLTDFDGNLSASALRMALYAQDEWALNKQWSAQAGLRWEGIRTQGTGAVSDGELSNRSSVVTPLLHAVWRPSEAAKDQVRFSLTRSYRSPNLPDLIARPTLNSAFLTRGANEEIHPDRAGNAALKPELASGLDVAFEHFLPGGGILSANVFVRRISNLMRSVTALETVSWADVPRWVSRVQNIGNATTRGVELEAKFRASELIADAPKVDVRANASLFSSSVEGVNGPDNRLAQQPDGTLNLGADYKVPGWPITLGGNLNFTPGYTTQLSNNQSATVENKRVLDTYMLWAISPTQQLRVSASNLDPRDYVTAGTVFSVNPLGQSTRESTRNTAPGYVNLQVRLELKL